jgi:hypothetical protein
VGRYGGKDIPAVECVAQRLQEERLIAYGAQFIHVAILDNQAQSAIVRGKEKVPVLFTTDGFSLSTHAGINHDDMDGVYGEIPEGALDDESCLHNVMSGKAMCNINDLNATIDRKNNALHDAYIFILKAKIGY